MGIWQRFFFLEGPPVSSVERRDQAPGYGQPIRLENQEIAQQLSESVRLAAGHAVILTEAEAKREADRIAQRDGTTIHFD